MIENKKFKEIGFNVAQIGFYLMSIDSTLFANTELHRNIVSLLSQVSLYLNDNLDKPLASANAVIVNTERQYVSKAEAIELYHPLLTEYGLKQAINKNEIKYIKRGTKYFFESKDLKKWIDENRSNNVATRSNKSIKFV